MVYFLGTLVESLKVAEIYAPLVKTRKKTEELPLLDTFRLIQDEIEELEIEGIVEDRVAYWINKFKRNYRSGQHLKKEDSDELLIDAKTMDEMIFRELIDRPILELSHKGALNTKALLKNF
jgi:hypothetical protein